MIAAHRKMMALRVWIVTAFHFANAAPLNCGGIAVLFVAGYDATLAADALRHIEVEAVLFAVNWRPIGN